MKSQHTHVMNYRVTSRASRHPAPQKDISNPFCASFERDFEVACSHKQGCESTASERRAVDRIKLVAWVSTAQLYLLAKKCPDLVREAIKFDDTFPILYSTDHETYQETLSFVGELRVGNGTPFKTKRGFTHRGVPRIWKMWREIEWVRQGVRTHPTLEAVFRDLPPLTKTTMEAWVNAMARLQQDTDPQGTGSPFGERREAEKDFNIRRKPRAEERLRAGFGGDDDKTYHIVDSKDSHEAFRFERRRVKVKKMAITAAHIQTALRKAIRELLRRMLKN